MVRCSCHVGTGVLAPRALRVHARARGRLRRSGRQRLEPAAGDLGFVVRGTERAREHPERPLVQHQRLLGAPGPRVQVRQPATRDCEVRVVAVVDLPRELHRLVVLHLGVRQATNLLVQEPQVGLDGGDAQRVTAADAALVNGTAAHGEDFDDTFEGGPVHSGAVIVPAALAAAERDSLPGARVMVGMAAGLEVLCRLGLVAPKAIHKAGFHPTAVLGSLAAAFAAGVTIYLGHRAQTRREQRYGESLRDQISRRLAQLDDAATTSHRRSVAIFVLMGAVWPVALLHLGMRVNDKSLSDVSWVTIALFIVCFLIGARSLRRSVQQAATRKRELEALLQDLDGS